MGGLLGGRVFRGAWSPADKNDLPQKGLVNFIRRAQMPPVLGGTIVEGQQLRLVASQRGDGFRILRVVLGRERFDARLGLGARRRVHDRVERLLRLRLQPLRQLVEDVRQSMHPTALLPRLGPDRADGGPEAEGAVAHGDDRRTEAATLEIPQHRRPAVGAFAVAVFNGDQFLGPVGRTPIITSVQSRSSSSRTRKCTPSTQT